MAFLRKRGFGRFRCECYKMGRVQIKPYMPREGAAKSMYVAHWSGTWESKFRDGLVGDLSGAQLQELLNGISTD